MPPKPKYSHVKSVIKRRIREGDYLVDSIPGERRIAEETGVSYMTARRAVQELLEEDVLIRQASGALGVHPSFSKLSKPAEVVLLYPAFPSGYLTQLRMLVTEAAAQHGLGIRPGQYVHWEEQALVDVATQAKGAMVIPYGPSIPPGLVERFQENKVVILDGDFSGEELPSIRLFSESCIEHVMEHLWDLGHRHIDCINTQNRNPEIDRRISVWNEWLAIHGGEGVLHDDPTPVFTDPTIVAYDLMNRLLKRKRTGATAFLGTTCPAAIGAIRACYEKGINVGEDLSIAAMNLEPPAEFFCPSITGLTMPDLSQVLSRCFDWFESDDGWKGPYLLEPEYSSLFEGESTGIPEHKTSRVTQ